MAVHHDILDDREPLGRFLPYSIGLHLALFAAVVSARWWQPGEVQPWGDPRSLGGGAVAITPVSRIPLPSRGGPENPVANDTDSRVPQPPKPEPRRQREPDPDAITIKGRARTAQRQAIESRKRYRPPETDRPNQLYSEAGAAARSPLFGSTSGSSRVNVGSGSPFGARFGYYEALLRQRVAEKWRTADIDPRLESAPPVIVTFEILRNGTVRGLRLMQRSGNVVVDYSAQRAIVEASPFPPLPAGFDRDSAVIEFWFQLKR